jgi:hypothetical protein
MSRGPSTSALFVARVDDPAACVEGTLAGTVPGEQPKPTRTQGAATIKSVAAFMVTTNVKPTSGRHGDRARSFYCAGSRRGGPLHRIAREAWRKRS